MVVVMGWADMRRGILLHHHVAGAGAAAVVVDIATIDVLHRHVKRLSRDLAFWLGSLRGSQRLFHRAAQPHGAGRQADRESQLPASLLPFSRVPCLRRN